MRLSAGLDFILFPHGNHDAGPVTLWRSARGPLPCTSGDVEELLNWRWRDRLLRMRQLRFGYIRRWGFARGRWRLWVRILRNHYYII